MLRVWARGPAESSGGAERRGSGRVGDQRGFLSRAETRCLLAPSRRKGHQSQRGNWRVRQNEVCQETPGGEGEPVNTLGPWERSEEEGSAAKVYSGAGVVQRKPQERPIGHMHCPKVTRSSVCPLPAGSKGRLHPGASRGFSPHSTLRGAAQSKSPPFPESQFLHL